MSGGVFKRCGCRSSETGRLLSSACPQLAGRDHGSWYFDRAVPVLLGRREDKPRVVSVAPHHLGVTPWVRYRDRLDGDARGIIAPLTNIQDRINASFRQRWATGLVIPQDDERNPVEPFKAVVDRLRPPVVTDNS